VDARQFILTTPFERDLGSPAAIRRAVHIRHRREAVEAKIDKTLAHRATEDKGKAGDLSICVSRNSARSFSRIEVAPFSVNASEPSLVGVESPRLEDVWGGNAAGNYMGVLRAVGQCEYDT